MEDIFYNVPKAKRARKPADTTKVGGKVEFYYSHFYRFLCSHLPLYSVDETNEDSSSEDETNILNQNLQVLAERKLVEMNDQPGTSASNLETFHAGPSSNIQPLNSEPSAPITKTIDAETSSLNIQSCDAGPSNSTPSITRNDTGRFTVGLKLNDADILTSSITRIDADSSSSNLQAHSSAFKLVHESILTPIGLYSP